MPEDINSILTECLSSLLFPPKHFAAVKNIQLEGITEFVFKVGDVMFDDNFQSAKEKYSNTYFVYKKE